MKPRFTLLAWCLAAALLLMTACSPLSASPPSIESATLTDQVDERTMAALHPRTAFPAATQRIFAAVKVADATKGTKVEAQWFYNKDSAGYLHVDNAVYIFEKGVSQHVAFSLVSTEGLPKGEYKVVILLDGQETKEIPFTVE